MAFTLASHCTLIALMCTSKLIRVTAFIQLNKRAGTNNPVCYRNYIVLVFLMITEYKTNMN